MRRVGLVVACVIALVVGVFASTRRRHVDGTLPAPTASAPASISKEVLAVASSEPPPPPIAPVNVIVPGDRHAVVVRGQRRDAGEARAAMLFMAGMCMHPGGYAGAFQRTAAVRGDLVALQGDVSCGGGPDSSVRRWASDLDALDRRIDAAFVAAGFGSPAEIVAIGYSQGAERAEQLAARWPRKYSRLVLIASPMTPSPARLAHTRAVVTMAGTNDVSLERMRASASSLRRAGVHAAFFVLPNAYHGQMGDTPEESMRAALDFALQ